MIVAAYDRVRKGKNVVEPDRSLSHAANFLLMLNGAKPSQTAERALDIALILHADHELNASTFAARVTAATLSDMHSAVDCGHRSSERPAARRRQRSGLPHSAKRSTSRRRPGGVTSRHAGAEEESSRVSAIASTTPKIPRATHLRKMSEDLGKSSGQSKWFEMSHARSKNL